MLTAMAVADGSDGKNMLCDKSNFAPASLAEREKILETINVASSHNTTTWTKKISLYIIRYITRQN
jgi:hypothetical protein